MRLQLLFICSRPGHYDFNRTFLSIGIVPIRSNIYQGFVHIHANFTAHTHDHTFTQTVANRIVEISSDGFVDKLGTYDEYVASLEAGKVLV